MIVFTAMAMAMVMCVIVIVGMTAIFMMVTKVGQSRDSLSQDGQPQHDHPGSVRDGNGQPEEERVTGRSPAANQIGTDHGLAVPRGERMHRAPRRRGEEG